MRERRPPRNAATSHAVDGVLLLDKPAGITSHTAVQRVRRLLGAQKAGHTGTLDPLATGLLPVCLGEATKFSHALLGADKTYLATIRLGVETATGDLEGEIRTQTPVDVDEERARAALIPVVGEILQVPPMYSAIKHHGQPLYKLARAGRELPRAPRPVLIRELRMIRVAPPDLDVLVTCSKGTYVRVLAQDIGGCLGCGGCLAALRRTAVGEFSDATTLVSLERLEAMSQEQRMAQILPEDALLSSLPRLDLGAEEALRLGQGQGIVRNKTGAPGLVRIYGPGREFLGMAEVLEAGRIVPRRLRRAPALAAARASASIA